MLNMLLIVFQLLLLFLLSTHLKQLIYTILLVTTKNQKVTISLLSLLLFPGTVVHELAHLFTAGILFVPVGHMELVPKVVNGTIRAGSVQIGKTDPFRQTLVGIAPLFVGLAMLYAIARFLLPQLSTLRIGGQLLHYSLPTYLLFTISSTMFSSKKDMDAAKLVLPIFALLAISAYVAGFRFEVVQQLLINTTSIMETLNTALIISLIIHLVLWLGLRGIRSMVGK